MTEPFEKVDHPLHYNMLPANCDKCGDTIECIEVVRHMNFNLGNAVKYVWRAGWKDGDPIEDLRKARWYLDDEIKRLEHLIATSGGVHEADPPGYVQEPDVVPEKPKEGEKGWVPIFSIPGIQEAGVPIDPQKRTTYPADKYPSDKGTKI